MAGRNSQVNNLRFEGRWEKNKDIAYQVISIKFYVFDVSFHFLASRVIKKSFYFGLITCTNIAEKKYEFTS